MGYPEDMDARMSICIIIPAARLKEEIRKKRQQQELYRGKSERQII